MSVRGTILALGVLGLGLPALGAAQGLGDVAAREREAREKQASEKKSEEPRSFSNDDLEGLSERTNEDGEGTVSTPGGAPVPAPVAGGRATGRTRTPEQMRQAREKPLEDAVARDQARVQALEASVEELQQRLNPMSTTYVYGGTGGPVGGSQSTEEMTVRRQLAAVEQQLAQARQALSSSQSALEQAQRAPATSVRPRN